MNDVFQERANEILEAMGYGLRKNRPDPNQDPTDGEGVGDRKIAVDAEMVRNDPVLQQKLKKANRLKRKAVDNEELKLKNLR